MLMILMRWELGHRRYEQHVDCVNPDIRHDPGDKKYPLLGRDNYL